MGIALSTESIARARNDVCILLAWPNTSPLTPASGASAHDLGRMVAAWSRRSGFRARAGELTHFPTWGGLPAAHVIVVGLGNKDDWHVDILRRAVGAAVRRACRLGARSVGIAVDSLKKLHEPEPAAVMRSLATAIHRALYRVESKLTVPRRVPSFTLYGSLGRRERAAAVAALREGEQVGQLIGQVRELANKPGNEAPPEVIASHAAKLARANGLRFEAWDRRKLAREKCNALLAVSQGSHRQPRLIIMRYAGRKKKLPPLVLVGKTITFDTGGISIKPAKGMEWMRYDKSGGMAVLAAMLVIARMKPDRPVIGILAAAENMPGGAATRPGDVVRARSGKTIEIINTDAEGRLVLADALSVAQDFKPAAILDFATLTGAAVTALGHVTSAVMGHTRQVQRVMLAGERTGDRVWPLPLYREYQEMLKTPFADIKNTGDGTAGAIAGGMFLSQFVAKDLPWVHVDITNAWEEKEPSFSAAGANMFGAELAWEWVKMFDH